MCACSIIRRPLWNQRRNISELTITLHWTNGIFLVFEWPLTWKRFRACTAALSRRMYWLRSKVVILKEPKLASSERSSRYLMTACKQDVAIWKKGNILINSPGQEPGITHVYTCQTCFSISGSAALDTVSPLRAFRSRFRSCTMSLVVNSDFFLSVSRMPPRCTTWIMNSNHHVRNNYYGLYNLV